MTSFESLASLSMMLKKYLAQKVGTFCIYIKRNLILGARCQTPLHQAPSASFSTLQGVLQAALTGGLGT